MKSLQGQLLIASRHLLDGNFVKTVILLIQHDEEGAFGVVINRPTCKVVKELWQEVGETGCESEQPVYLGGPVSGPLVALHTHKPSAEMIVAPKVFFAATKENLEVLVRQENYPYRIFVGNAGWGAGQLENELQQGAWLTMPATAEFVFGTSNDLWETISKRAGKAMLQSILHLKHIPDDPSVN